MSNLKGINIGIDLGSTNSSVFVYDLDDVKAKPLDVTTGSPLIPSVVSFNPTTKGYGYGLNAKNTTMKKVRVFKAFKMLLSEKDSEILKDRRYDTIPDGSASEEDKKRANTPENITRLFLKYIIDSVLLKTGADYISNLVVGFPEVWNDVETVGARFVLREICSDILKEIAFSVKDRTGIAVKTHVEVRTEPECASAFIAKEIERELGQNYNGNLLIIDYGGGTLDITLSRIETNADGCMEIKVLGRKGAGENNNADKQIGNAGIIYMESVIEEAIRYAEVCDKYGDPLEEIPHDNKFYAAVNQLENYITSGESRKALEITFKGNGLDEEALKDLYDEYDEDDADDEEDSNPGLFCSVEYPGAGDEDELLIPYFLMARCYNKIIAPTLEEKVNLIMDDMLENDIQYMSSQIDDFKIAIVGGFGRFYPVREQIYKLFKSDYVHDRRMVKISEDEAELAIAHGACLLSEGILKIRKTSRLEIGMVQRLGSKVHVQTAIRYGQEIDKEEVYYCRDEKDRRYKYWLEGASIREFWINYSDKEIGAHIGALKDKIRTQLDSIRDFRELPVVIGFSIDESDVLTMHIQNVNPHNGELLGKPKDFVMSRYDDMFDISSYV